MGCGYSNLEADEVRNDSLRRSRSTGASRRLYASFTAPIHSPEEENGADSSEGTADSSTADGANLKEDKKCELATRKKTGPDQDEKREMQVSAERKEEGQGSAKGPVSSFICRNNADLPGSPSFRFYFSDQILDSGDDDESLLPEEKTGRKDSIDSTSSELRTLLSRSPTSPEVSRFGNLNNRVDARGSKRFGGRALKGLTKGTGTVCSLFKHRSLPYGSKRSPLTSEKVA